MNMNQTSNPTFSKAAIHTIKHTLKQLIGTFFKEAFQKRNVRYLVYYGFGNFVLLILYTVYERSVSTVDLSLNPATTTVVQSNWILWVLAVLLLPLSLFLEELGFRMLPKVFIKDIFQLDTITISEEHDGVVTEVNHSPVRWWVYHHWHWIFIVVSACWAGLIHQLNVVESSPLGSLIYFGMQFFSGLCFAWIYIHKGIGSSWVVHLSWDFFIVILSLFFV